MITQQQMLKLEKEHGHQFVPVVGNVVRPRWITKVAGVGRFTVRTADGWRTAFEVKTEAREPA